MLHTSRPFSTRPEITVNTYSTPLCSPRTVYRPLALRVFVYTANLLVRPADKSDCLIPAT